MYKLIEIAIFLLAFVCYWELANFKQKRSCSQITEPWPWATDIRASGRSCSAFSPENKPPPAIKCTQLTSGLPTISRINDTAHFKDEIHVVCKVEASWLRGPPG